MADNIRRVGLLLFGSLTWQRVLLIISPAIIVGSVVWMLYDGALWQRIIVVLLTIDLVAGAISNATPHTNAQWRTLAHWQQGLFVLAHLVIYPLLMMLFVTSGVLFWSMIVVLLIKMFVFVRGVLYRP